MRDCPSCSGKLYLCPHPNCNIYKCGEDYCFDRDYPRRKKNYFYFLDKEGFFNPREE
jgi:hypothetical protein